VSRIAGARGFGGPPAAGAIETMAGALRRHGTWEVSAAGPTGASSITWVGEPARGRIAGDADTSLAIDGTIFNLDDFGDPSQPAQALLESFRSGGIDGLLGRLNGDFSVAVADRSADRLWVARDRFGCKPMYWTRTAWGVAFASQPRGLLALPGVSDQVDPRYVALVAGAHYRTFDNDREASPFAQIHQLPAAHLLEVGPGGAVVRPWWSLEPADIEGLDEESLAERYRSLLADAVDRRVRAFARPAFTLSGGMDSSSVLASAVRATGSRQHAFSSTYSDATYDESHEIRSMLDETVERWHTVPVDDPDVFGLVRRMVAAHDEPVATATWLSHFVLAEQARASGFSSLFGGLGGDELNAGEYEYFVFFFADLAAAGRNGQLESEISAWAALHDHPVWRKSPDVARAELARRIDPSIPGGNRPDLPRLLGYAGAVEPDVFDLAGWTPVMDHPFRSHLANRSFQDLYRETTPCCLRAEDRNTSAFGIDHADPFLDHRVVELMFAVPGDMKIRQGVTKTLLRAAMRGVLPEETRTRVAKVGWNAPAHLWFAGPAGDELDEMVNSERFRSRGIYRVDEVQRLLTDHRAIVASGRPAENHMMFLWQLVNLEMWFQWLEQGRP
jgi:asparagine synthase (glutamine-hydrolysing)